jgi:hypothetical protein
MQREKFYRREHLHFNKRGVFRNETNEDPCGLVLAVFFPFVF